MNWKKIAGIVAGIAIVAVMVWKLKSNKEIAQESVFQFDKESPIGILTETVKAENVANPVAFSGTFEPFKESKISAEQPGKINEIMVDVGSQVRKGQALLELDNALLKLQMQSIDVQIEGLQNDVNRYTILSQADAIQGVQLEKAEMALKSAKVQKATISEQISKTTIRAPYDGIITAKMNEEGAYAAPGLPLLQVTDISVLKFTIQVPETDLKRFADGQVYDISIDAFPDVPVKGALTLIGSKANVGSSFPVQFKVRNTPDTKIKSGMFGKVDLNYAPNHSGITIPASAVIGTSDQYQVYLVKQGKAVLQNISIAERIQNKVVVSDGLQAGDVLVTGGFTNLFEGANVSVEQNSEK